MKKFVSRLIWIVRLRCNEHREMTAASLDRPLSKTERLAVAGHRIACGPCRRFVRSMNKLAAITRSSTQSLQHATLREQKREEIKRLMQRMNESS